MIPKDFLLIVSDNEQDRMHMLKWWKESTYEEKEAVWNAIQVQHDDPVQELVTRFAQVAFGEMVEKEWRGEI